GTDSTFVVINSLNDPPQLTLSNDYIIYSEGDPATILDPALTLIDADGPGMSSAMVTISSEFVIDEDVLAARDTLGISAIFDTTNGELSLIGSATAADYQAILRTVSYWNSNDIDPGTSPRIITFQASDGIDSVWAAVTVNVIGENDPPNIVVGGIVTYTESDPPVIINQNLTVEDADGPPMTGASVSITTGFTASEDTLAVTDTLGISGAYNEGVGRLDLSSVESNSATDYQTILRTVTYQNLNQLDPDENDRTIVFEVNDGSGSVSATATIDIETSNDEPYVPNPIADIFVDEDWPDSTINLSNVFADPDVENATFTYTVLSNSDPDLITTVIDHENRWLVLSFTENDSGQAEIVIEAESLARVRDEFTVNDTFMVIVAAVNDPPTNVHDIPDQETWQDSTFSFQFADNIFNDVDPGDTLTFSATIDGEPLTDYWLEFDSSSRTFSGIPQNEDVTVGQPLAIVIRAIDTGGATANAAFEITVFNINDPPVLFYPIPDTMAVEDTYFSFIFDDSTFIDDDELVVTEVLTYHAQQIGSASLPAWLDFEANERKFSGNPVNDDVGMLQIMVSATDLQEDTANDTFNITVQNVNDAPYVTNEIADTTAILGELFEMQIEGTFADPDDDDDVLIYFADLAN
ncbi:MAG: hypothetical protein GY869_31620, partial [Planctomycetes bacterium]|nr:hypothetical protein [Planctomycetota bacterium]